MISSAVHGCECPDCRSRKPHPDRTYHHHINLLLSRLNEPQRRWFVALEVMRTGRGGKQLLAQITGMSPTTIWHRCNELKADLASCPEFHLRAAGGGRPAAQDRDPELERALEIVLASETAGDPMGKRARTKRSSLQHLSATLKDKGHPVSAPTVAKLLRKLQYSPKANARRTEARSASAAQRHEQFDHINEQRDNFSTTGDPIISVDTKKKS